MIYVTGDMHGDYRVFKQTVFKNIKKNDTPPFYAVHSVSPSAPPSASVFW